MIRGSQGPLLTTLPQDTDLLPPEEELDYVSMLNQALPPTVRVTGWADVPDNFSARYSTGYRVYRYYFVRRGLDLEVSDRGPRSAHPCRHP